MKSESWCRVYEYACELIRIVDGDTAHVRVDLGLDVRFDITLRFAGINAPELNTPEGPPARQFVVDNLPLVFTIRTVKDHREKYGRYLAWLLLSDGRCLNRMLVDAGHAVGYGNLPIDPW